MFGSNELESCHKKECKRREVTNVMINSPEISHLMYTLINRRLIYEDLVSVSTIPADERKRRKKTMNVIILAASWPPPDNLEELRLN